MCKHMAYLFFFLLLNCSLRKRKERRKGMLRLNICLLLQLLCKGQWAGVKRRLQCFHRTSVARATASLLSVRCLPLTHLGICTQRVEHMSDLKEQDRKGNRIIIHCKHKSDFIPSSPEIYKLTESKNQHFFFHEADQHILGHSKSSYDFRHHH